MILLFIGLCLKHGIVLEWVTSIMNEGLMRPEVLNYSHGML